MLEKHRDGLKNELAKKSYNHDIVQQGFDKEKRKVGCLFIHFLRLKADLSTKMLYIRDLSSKLRAVPGSLISL